MRVEALFCGFVAAFAYCAANPVPAATPENERIINAFVHILSGDAAYAEQGFGVLDEQWDDGFAAMSLDAVALISDPARSRRLVELLQDKTGENHGYDISAWYDWLWNRPPEVHPAYGDVKAAIFGLIDPDFRAYFSSDRATEIRLDEIRWGGVAQDGIPPLRNPKMIRAPRADYLADDDIVFGLQVNGDVRAYPKRILAWHEMFTDTVGGEAVVGVYCTLCGSMILYRAAADGTEHTIGTSGFLYRSNKLMYDRVTQSLWSTLWGRPVVGPLVGQGIELEALSVVTTRWGAWRARHPDTQVLSLDTGHTRDYSEGAAYRDYFATDEIMFGVPELDRRLKNKDEIFGLVLRTSGAEPLAISSAYLADHPLFNDAIGDIEFVVLTDSSGAHRAFEAEGAEFVEYDGDAAVIDADGRQWTLTEPALTSSDGRVRNRIAAHRAFWFGWYAAYPNTRLIR